MSNATAATATPYLTDADVVEAEMVSEAKGQADVAFDQRHDYDDVHDSMSENLHCRMEMARRLDPRFDGIPAALADRIVGNALQAFTVRCIELGVTVY